MAITINDLLTTCPSLKDARLVAGPGGLDHFVSSVSVLEYVDTDATADQLYAHHDFIGGELVISGFVAIKDDIQAQCDNIRRLSQCGESGLILYYVGVFLPAIAPPLITLCNTLDFPLICMPEGRVDLRYAAVITDVMEQIFLDRGRMAGQGRAPSEDLVAAELIRAILKDDPLKMHRLADVFGVDVAAIETLWILKGAATRSGRNQLKVLAADLLTHQVRPFIADSYEDMVVLFMGNLGADAPDLAQALLDDCQAAGLTVTLSCFSHLQDTRSARLSYLTHQKALSPARRVFPRKSVFTGGDLTFVQNLCQTAKAGESQVSQLLTVLLPLEDHRESGILLSTLTTYLLDEDSRIPSTASALFVHPNTIKYRLRKIEGLLGHPLKKMPEALSLYTAAALRRLLQI
ncbi:PucR family transcriptional regulator [Eubacterium sp.]|uniref:PucR family transcriptional regulator n=1 Tax=Eubacterium sp. TaxID=142586 RepID=UPI002FC714CD